jgi:hypothetical protein
MRDGTIRLIDFEKRTSEILTRTGLINFNNDENKLPKISNCHFEKKEIQKLCGVPLGIKLYFDENGKDSFLIITGKNKFF